VANKVAARSFQLLSCPLQKSRKGHAKNFIPPNPQGGFKTKDKTKGVAASRA